MPYYSHMNNRVSNPTFASDDRTGMVARPYGGSNALLEFGRESTFVAAGEIRPIGGEFSNGLHMRRKQSSPHQDFWVVYNSFRLYGNSLPNGPNSNNVKVAPSCGFGRERGPSGASAFNESELSVPW